MYLNLLDKNKYKILHQREVEKLSLVTALYKSGDWNAEHQHENARFVFVLQGNFTERYERKERFCKPFTGIFRPPQERHSEIYEEGVVCLGVSLTPSWLKRLENYSVKLKSSNDFRNQTLRQLITKVSNEMFLDDDISTLAIDSLLTEIAVEMYRNFSNSKKDKSPYWLKTVVEYIHENFSLSISLDEIASVVGVHPVHLSRVFRDIHNFTIAEYLRNLRIEEAQNLLLNSDLSLAQIATQVGFADQSHFTKNFKRLTYKTPAQYRKNIKSS